MNALDIIPVSIAIILFVLFALYYWSVYHQNQELAQSNKDNWPPYKSHCPDYWNPIGNNICENTHNIGVPECLKKPHGKIKNIQNNRVSFHGVSKENKCSWAKKCEVPWEGVDTLGGCTA
jgi:hypothetical protein